jgi:hypothetical protein
MKFTNVSVILDMIVPPWHRTCMTERLVINGLLQ